MVGWANAKIAMIVGFLGKRRRRKGFLFFGAEL
jgi:hypothetical protein